MKNSIKLFVLFALSATMSFAQKINNLEGDKSYSFLSSGSEMNVKFDYSDMSVGKYKTEIEYVQAKVEEYNSKEAGKGDSWRESWYGSRERVYHVKFMELLTKGLAKPSINATEGDDAPITLTVHTTFTEPGFNVGVASKPASINVEYIFTNTEDGSVLAKFEQKGVPGAQAMGMDFDTSTRISESYAKAGKMLAAAISKSVK